MALKWKDSDDSVETEVFYVARILSKYPHCRVDIFKDNQKIATFISGHRKLFTEEGAAA